MQDMEIDNQEVIAKLLNKIAFLELRVAQLETGIEQMQRESIVEVENGND